MSLVQRATYVDTASIFLHNEDLAQVLDVLRTRVSEIVSPVKAARLISLNPRQAKSELRLACEQVLKEEPWLVKRPFTAEGLVERY